MRSELTSVVIPARNAAGHLADQLDALIAQDYRGDFEVIVVDHHSTDRTGAVAASFATRLPLRVVRTERNGGANLARNDGARHARGDLLVFCDADDVATPGWLSALVRAAGTADLVGGDLETYELNAHGPRTWRGLPDTLDTVGDARLGFLPYAPSGNFAVWAEVFAKLGGFPEEYRRGCDEMALSWRAQLAGYRVAAAPGATMHYRFRTTVPQMARQHFGYGRAEARLFREFRSQGMPRSDSRAAVRVNLRLLAALPLVLAGRSDRGLWARTAAIQAGRMIGSLEHRVMFL